MNTVKVRDQYDWVVIGTHPGALLTASLAAKLGLSVLVLPAGNYAQLSDSDIGHPLDPESNFVLGLGKEGSKPGLTQLCLAHAGILPAESHLIRTREALTSVLTPSRRFDLFSDDDLLENEMHREFGSSWLESTGLVAALREHQGDVDEFWTGFPSRFDRQEKKRPKHPAIDKQLDTLGRKINRSFKGLRDQPAEVVNAFGAAWMGVIGPIKGQHEEPPLRSELLHTLAVARKAGSFRGGITAYRSFLIKLAQRLGAHVLLDARCSRIWAEQGRLTAVEISERTEKIAVGGGVLGCSLNHAKSLLASSGRSWFRRMKSSPPANGWKFTLALTVREEAIPGSLLRRSIWQEPGAPMLEIEHCDPAEYGHPIPGARLIFARACLPFDETSLDPQQLRLIASRIFKQLTELLPFIEFHVIKIHPDFRQSEEKATDEIREAYPYETLSALPENLRVYSEGVGKEAGVAGLFVATGEAYPRLGSLGPTVAAVESIAWLADKHQLKGPLA